MTSFDVAVLGGGPAGIAIAATLQRRGHRVVVFERGAYEMQRIGESLGGEVAPLLRSLGAWDAMAEVLGTQVPFFAVRSAWGSDALVERSAMLHPHGPGWHVERARFDGRLARWAASLGVDIRTRTGTCTAVRDGGGVRVVPRHGEAATARFLVDASGRGAPASRALGDRRWLACDRQIAMIARLPGDRGSELLVEAAEDGWWYSAPQPDGSLVVAHISDGDLGGPRVFAASLARTIHTAARVGRVDPLGSVRVVRADSGRSFPDCGRDWCVAGDAAIARDPLAGDGVSNALRDALELADPIAHVLAGGEPEDRIDRDRRFRDYLDRREGYYALEARWPDAPFWRRRRPGAWRDAPVTLHPETLLARAASPDRAALAPVEALLPPRAIAAALAAVAVPIPAHRIMTALRASAPLGDRRLLVGLQQLVERGILVRSQ